MPPKQRGSSESGPEAYGDVAFALEVSETHGIPLAEVEAALARIDALVTCIATEDDVTQPTTEAMAMITDFETRFGTHVNWDDLRLHVGLALACSFEFDYAAPILAGAHHAGLMVERVDDYLTEPDFLTAFEDDDEYQAFLNAFYDKFYAAIRATGNTTDPARLRSWAVDWDYVDTLIATEVWPDALDQAGRQKVGEKFGRLQHALLMGADDAARFNDLRSYLDAEEQTNPATVWDYLRALTASTLLSNDFTESGLAMAGLVRDPGVQAVLAVELIHRGNDAHALPVVMQLHDLTFRGKLIVAGQWQDRQMVRQIADAISDPHNDHTYPMADRITVTEGMLLGAEFKLQEAQSLVAFDYWQKYVAALTTRLAALRHLAGT